MSGRWVATTKDGRTIYLPSHWLESEVLKQRVDVHGEDVVKIVHEQIAEPALGAGDNPADITITGHHEVSG